MRRKISLLLLAILAPGVLWAQGYFEVSQGGLTRSVQPLEGTQDAAAFYAYAGFEFSSQCPLAADDTTVLFLYRDPAGELYLFVIHDMIGGPTGGSAELSIQGIPPAASVLVEDDPANVDRNDVYDVAAGRFTWVWGPGRTDGMVIGPLGPEFRLTIVPVALTGITSVAFLSGDLAAPERIELNTVDPITLLGSPNQRPVVSFTVSPAEPRIRQEVRFDAGDSYDPDGRIVEYRWDFDGDGVIDGSGQIVTHTYYAPGTYRVTLYVTDNMGASAQSTQFLQVVVPGPVGMPSMDGIPGVYIWGVDTWHITVNGAPTWASPHAYRIELRTDGTFVNVSSAPGPGPAPLGLVPEPTEEGWKVVFEGQVSSDRVTYTFEVRNATMIYFAIRFDVDGDGNMETSPGFVRLRQLMVNPPTNPFVIGVPEGYSGPFVPSLDFRIGIPFTFTQYSRFVLWTTSIEELEGSSI